MNLNRVFRPPNLWEWAKKLIPPSLEAREIIWAYSTSCNIYRKGESPGLLRRQFTEGEPVATVRHNEIVLHNPEYFSDFEDLLRNYEKQTGIETTLTYWASPKDDASHAAVEASTIKEKP